MGEQQQPLGKMDTKTSQLTNAFTQVFTSRQTPAVHTNSLIPCPKGFRRQLPMQGLPTSVFSVFRWPGGHFWSGKDCAIPQPAHRESPQTGYICMGKRWRIPLISCPLRRTFILGFWSHPRGQRDWSEAANHKTRKTACCGLCTGALHAHCR